MDWNLAVLVAGPVVGAVVGVLLDRWLERKPRVIAFLAHANAVRLSGQDTQVNTHTVVIRNAGRRTATNLRVTHNYLPDFSVFPPVAFEIVTLPDGVREIVIPQLVPGQQLNISYLYFPPMLFSNVNAGIRHDDGFAREVQVLPTLQPSRRMRYTIVTLLGLGFVSAIYLAIQVILWLLNVNAVVSG